MMVIDKMMGVIDSVMAETIASVECYGCDGILKSRHAASQAACAIDLFKKSSEKGNSIKVRLK